jgi:hypothetical protein
MNQNCQNCRIDFVIDERDQNNYKKIDVPHPTWCPKCRFIRRTANLNGWSLFYRDCDKCNKRTLSMYPADADVTVYCQPCWWADDWDGTEYGQEYDSTRPFLDQVKEVNDKTPHVALETTYLTLKDCDYCNAIAYGKNCMLATWSDYCENVFFSSFLTSTKDTVDCLRMIDSELCYESIGQNKGYRVFHSEECDSCTDVWFSRNCYSCVNCVGCVNIRGGSYMIFNEQYSKEEYAEKLKEFRLDTYSGQMAMKEQVQEFWSKFPYRAYTGNTLNVNVTGEYVYESKNSEDMFMSSGAEDCRYCQLITVKPARDCVDYSGWGNGAELIYDSANIGDNVSKVKFSYYCFPDCVELEYCMWVVAGKNNLGCANLKRKKYAILNKVYEKEEYEALREQIISDMKKRPFIDSTGKQYFYGEFFAPEFSKFAYNTSNANKFFPKTKDEALSLGYTWQEDEEQTAVATKNVSELPETISDTAQSIVKETIQCSTCPKKFRIVDGEYGLLKKMGMPIPRECLKCREARRFSRMNKPLELYERSCAKCAETMKTSFSPERPEIVYCVACYQQEFV